MGGRRDKKLLGESRIDGGREEKKSAIKHFPVIYQLKPTKSCCFFTLLIQHLNTV